MDLNQIDQTIEQKIAHFMNLISEQTNSDLNAQSFSRYKSWEWCYKYFQDHHDLTDFSNDEKESIIDTMALHLAFYLASWGMYRGSSFLLQRDYKAHIPAVKYILAIDEDSEGNLNQDLEKYGILWGFDPLSDDECNKAYKKLFGTDGEKGIYWKVKESYGKNCNDGTDETSQNEDKFADSEGSASETLVTKILLGTFGCLPAFDRYLKSGISIYNDKYNSKKSNNWLDKSIECKNNKNLFIKLCELYNNHIKDNAIVLENYPSLENYPPMKKVDMYFWEIGYEVDIQKQLKKAIADIESNDKRSRKKINHLYSLLSKMKVDGFDSIDQSKILEKINDFANKYQCL